MFDWGNNISITAYLPIAPGLENLVGGGVRNAVPVACTPRFEAARVNLVSRE